MLKFTTLKLSRCKLVPYFICLVRQVQHYLIRIMCYILNLILPLQLTAKRLATAHESDEGLQFVVTHYIFILITRKHLKSEIRCVLKPHSKLRNCFCGVSVLFCVAKFKLMYSCAFKLHVLKHALT